ncbi:MAG: VOC family protein [Pseudomonadota bacterium]
MKALLAALAMPIAIAAMPAAAQEAPPAVTLDHVALFVADPQKSIDFYAGLFGLKEIRSPFPPGGPRWMAFGNGLELHLQPGRKDPIALPRRVHFAVNVPNLDPVIAWLRAHDIVWVDSADRPGMVSRTRTDGVQQIFFQDPDGYWVEVNDVKKPET